MHMNPILSSSWRFAFLFSLLIIGFRYNCVSSGESIPTPTPWPEQFNALLFTNHTLTGTVRLQMNDLWYDWPNRRTMNRIQYQLGDYLRDVEWNNGTSYYFTNGPTGTCTTRLFPIGVLPPEWLQGATYLGRTWADGFDCHVYTKVDFIYYWVRLDRCGKKGRREEVLGSV
ncbi:transferring glycosyl group transferase [Rhynchospora pubera]|uniref:Transferring glycosyl group transferase n=1 Tax=Rhynchospora pubera TaxID=906938 RepID=A0AAV8BZ04_9POAL|nr:transferring glycosyl group transferase [Rhynchospora pubera]